jgi:hypothetical protein
LPSNFETVDGSAHRVDWTGAGFSSTPMLDIRIIFAEALARLGPDDGDLLQAPFPIVFVQCPDGTWVDADGIVINGGTLAIDTAPHCLVSASSTQIGVAMTTGPLLPAITTQPASITVGAGDPAVFSVVATGFAPLTYQWRRNGANIPNANSLPSRGLSSAQQSDSGARFSVIVTNRYGNVTSDEAVLTVGLPRTPMWSASRPLGAYGPDVDLPQAGNLGELEFVVWNDGGVLHGSAWGGAYPPIDALAEPARGRPRVLTAPNLLIGWIVFVDDSGGSACAPGSGDRLSAVAVRIGSPRSPRFSLYQSTGDCIAQFSAGLVDSTFADPAGIAFALAELNTGRLIVGRGGAFFDDSRADWVVAPPTSSPLSIDAACTGGPYLGADSLAGRRQTFLDQTNPITTGVLTWIANENLCAAHRDNGTWSQGAVVFDRAIGDPAVGPPEPVAAIDPSGNVLVVASRVFDPAVMPYRQEMTAAFRSATGGAWTVQALDSSAGAALPSAVFGALGHALVVWRPNLTSAPTTVYAAVRSPAGVWQAAQPISSPLAADTRFPRICADTLGGAVALYQERATATDPFTVWARLWYGGLWSAPGLVQSNGLEGRFAVCVPHATRSFLQSGVFAAWRETDPTDATRFRIAVAH